MRKCDDVFNNEKEELRIRAVVETAVDGVILTDSAGNILMFNASGFLAMPEPR
jgi:signal transduction histidine kinase